jgi:hypothetical protein
LTNQNVTKGTAPGGGRFRPSLFPAPLFPLFPGAVRWAAASVFFLSVPGVFAQCQQKVLAADYYLCTPMGWTTQANDREDRIDGCNREHYPCSPSKDDHPYPGVVVFSVLPSDRGYGIYQSPEDLIKKARLLGMPVPTISDVMLTGRVNTNRKCWLARRLLYGDLWEDIYFLTVGKHQFRVWVNYNEEPANIEGFRATVIQILSSVAPVRK